MRKLKNNLIFALRCALFSANIDVVEEGRNGVVLFHSFDCHLVFHTAEASIKDVVAK